jgi:hypothetical protein
MIFAVLGIYDYYNYTHDKDAKYLFDQGVLALSKNLPHYDNNGNSYYDILRHNAGPHYQKVHIALLSRMYDITHAEVFKLYHDKWQSFQGALFTK